MAAAEVKASGAMDGGDDYDDTQAFDALEKDFQRVRAVGRPRCALAPSATQRQTEPPAAANP